MSLETKHDLNEETVAKLQDLIQINLDSAQGFEEAGEKLSEASYQSLFSDLASQRRANVAQLQDVVEWNGERPREDGSTLASMHRAWINVRAAINNNDTHVIFCEAERGEDSIKHEYEDVLKSTAGSAVNDLLTEQYAKVKSGHDRVRDIRDQLAKK